MHVLAGRIVILEEEVPMVGNVRPINLVNVRATKLANNRRRLRLYDLKRVAEDQRSGVDQDVVVGAQTDDVAQFVWSIMWPSQWTDMRTFGIRASWCLQ